MDSITLKDGTEWPLNTAYNGDCLSFMRNLPDKCIDLVLTDPPYGIGAGSKSFINGSSKTKKEYFRDSDWDSKRPDKQIFDEILRISGHQIIWGGVIIFPTFWARLGVLFHGIKLYMETATQNVN